MNRLDQLFERKSGDILNIYYTAGHPGIEQTSIIARALAESGCDIIELGIPYSDPLADGYTIQESSSQALKNGMSLSLLFEQLRSIRESVETPVILMGYYNQMLQYGPEEFLKDAKEAGADGLIIPDLPMDIYENKYLNLFEKYDLKISFLITPQTDPERIQKAANLSSAFLYIVSQSSITGKSEDLQQNQLVYFKRIQNMKLPCRSLIGFGIFDKKGFQLAAAHSNGAIIGSAFIRLLNQSSDLTNDIKRFVKSLRN